MVSVSIPIKIEIIVANAETNAQAANFAPKESASTTVPKPKRLVVEPASILNPITIIVVNAEPNVRVEKVASQENVFAHQDKPIATVIAQL